MCESGSPLIAVDIGNSRAKLGLFRSVDSVSLPEPITTASVPRPVWEAEQFHLHFENADRADWWIASVSRPFATNITRWLAENLPDAAIRLMTHTHFPLSVEVDHPERVGADRLAGAVAANRLRRPDYCAITIDVGSAITVDLVSAAGAFCGGAILPGIGMSARALHEFTDLLPHLDLEDLAEGNSDTAFKDGPPQPIGRSTVVAMQSGLYWGAVGAMRELVDRIKQVAGRPCDVFLTGGAAPSVASLLGSDVRHVPHLVLSGIAIAATQEAT